MLSSWLPKGKMVRVSDKTPTEEINYHNRASKMINELNSDNIFIAFSEITNFIKKYKMSVQYALSLIDSFSHIRPNDIKLFTELYFKLSNYFSCIIKPKNEKLTTLLHYKGLKFENFEPKINEEEILNIYPTESPLYYIVWDKVDELKSNFPNIEIDQKINEITPFDCAIKYGSKLCFNFMKSLGAKYTDESAKYAIQGGNKDIFMQMIEDGKSFDNMINIALDYHNYEIADYIKSKYGQTFDSNAESMDAGNDDINSFLLANGGKINEIYIIFLFISIIDL
ncbi:hypothetical protein TVAG_269310 [Trichomonas vaginalis G3]|uniref:DUF3447 domain-containing protein n=1 Tax=Trichomonas vaginalis (strain ATCC PRA-98 / G3) TaxID=412133 RepID=A2EG44_TRIV3|nr:nerve growth factor signaling pathway [Trichomonas vaginalis G3]EAY08405.1 hypothetical protein TVAG_269310 [Trichomonas vaginalis G3]KAI5499312.1 nerve growth factor signaling pathway [Trichomonas vaginalis G3]|eukprot:XP_001320628.1 hypothetical protein [Trichomonas vaginalis G3]